MTLQKSTYATARRAFLAAAGAAGATTAESLRSPHPGPQGAPLFVDAIRLGPPDAARLLVLISGTHGVEGHCGSMIQTHLLDSGTLARRPDDMAVLLIHALNPYGFAWNRRVTGEGVDLNRNFVDFASPPPTNPGFDAELAAALSPPAERRSEADQALLAWLARAGAEARTIIARGQFLHPAAPFYGGAAPTWSRSVFEQIVERHMRRAGRVCLIDYHTGLGEPGTGQLIGTTSANQEDVAAAQAIWGNVFVPAGARGSVSYNLAGDLIGAARQLLPGVPLIAAAHEFGTVDEMTVMSALRSDHGAHRFGSEAAIMAARDEMAAAFFPGGPDWRRAVNAEAASAVAKVLETQWWPEA